MKKATCQIYCQNLKELSQDILTNDKKSFCEGHFLTVCWCFVDRFQRKVQVVTSSKIIEFEAPLLTSMHVPFTKPDKYLSSVMTMTND